MNENKKTLFEYIKYRASNHPIVVSIMLGSMVIIGLSQLTGAISQLHKIISTEGELSVEPTNPRNQQDLSDFWSDTDSRLVSKEMINDLSSREWIAEHLMRTGKRPVLIIGNIQNLSHEHIDVSTFIADIEREVLNSANIKFVASKQERIEIRKERSDQEVYSSEGTRKEKGQEMGADFILLGSIKSISDIVDKEKILIYQVDLSLISLLDNSKRWVGQKKIKKHLKVRK